MVELLLVVELFLVLLYVVELLALVLQGDKQNCYISLPINITGGQTDIDPVTYMYQRDGI